MSDAPTLNTDFLDLLIELSIAGAEFVIVGAYRLPYARQSSTDESSPVSVPLMSVHGRLRSISSSLRSLLCGKLLSSSATKGLRPPRSAPDWA